MRQRTMSIRRALADKICRVCGDKASCFNFNVVTCESCKSFFRRWGRTGQTFRCPYGKRCPVNIATRRSCQKCRMDKCLEAGMVHPLAGTQPTPEPSECDTTPMTIDSFGGSQSPTESLPPTAHTPECTCECKCGRNNVDYDEEDDFEQLLRDVGEFTLADTIGWRRSSGDDELMHVEQYLKYPNMPKGTRLDGNNRAWYMFLDLDNMLRALEHLTLIVVQLGQQFEFFRSLSHDDQMKLYTRNSIAMVVMNTRFCNDGYMPFASAGSQMVVPTAIFDVFHGMLKKNYNVEERKKRFHQTFDPEMINDWRLMLLLQAITLYDTSADTQLDNIAGVRAQSLRYKRALYAHLLTHYDGTSRATFLYRMLMCKRDEARKAESTYRGVYAITPTSEHRTFPMTAMILSDQYQMKAICT